MATIGEVLARQFRQRPDAPAVVCGHEQLGYRELDALTAGAATTLSRHGVAPGATVGLTVERGLVQVACVVGLVRAGRAFCFVDRRSPPAWNRDVIARAGITHVVGMAGTDLGAPVAWIAPDQLLGGPAEPPVEVAPDDAVYVNFSSGTTGAPKVIPCTHRGVLGFCHAPRHLAVGPATRFLYSAPLTFDASQLELWLPLLNGGCVVVNGDRYLTAAGLRRLIDRDGVDAAWLTSSLLNTLVDVDPACVDGLRHLVTGGEEASPRHIEAVYRADPAITVHNGYGPTETTIITTMYAVPRDHDFARKIPIGRPIEGSRLVVVDPAGQAVPDGEVGELVITGPGLSPGYLGDPALTAEKFRPVAIDGVAVRGYWSGDLVARDADGVIHYHARRDDQLKIRGNRVALADITRAFAGHPQIRACAAVAIDHALALAYVPADPALAPAEVAQFGRERLPDFMVPGELVAVDALPLTASGKVDRRELAARIVAARGPLAPADDGAAAGFVRRAAGLDRWPRGRGFLDAGGDSLGAIKLISAVNHALGAERLTLEDVYAAPTLAALLARLPARLAASAADEDDGAPVPLSPAQRSMAYAEQFGDRTYNNVVYLFRPEALDRPSLDALAGALAARFPLLGCLVADRDDELVLVPHATALGVDPDLAEHDDAAACVAAALARPISLFDGPLLSLFRARIAGRDHVGVRLHHLVGDHVGQTELLRAIAEGAPAGAPDRACTAANRRRVREADREHERCAAFWSAQAIAVPEVARHPVTSALAPVVRRRSWSGARRDRAPSEQLLGWLAATAAAVETVFAAREPVLLGLFSLRDTAAGLGFQTCLAPIAMTAERATAGRPRPALLGALRAIHRHCVIGLEEILVAAGLDRARLPFLFNFVELGADDARWWRDHLVDVPSEPCKTELDVTVLRAGDTFDVTVTTRHDAACADALLDALAALRPHDDDALPP